MLLKATSMQPTFHFHPMCTGTNITHLAYEDDLLLFARVDDPTITLIADYLVDFRGMEELHRNLSKSSLFLTEVKDHTSSRLLEIISFQ